MRGRQYGYERISCSEDNKESRELVPIYLVYDDEYTKNALVREIEIMKNVKSPNIIQFIEIQQTPNNIYIFQELANGGTLD